jgi:hypothetical protein
LTCGLDDLGRLSSINLERFAELKIFPEAKTILNLSFQDPKCVSICSLDVMVLKIILISYKLIFLSFDCYCRQLMMTQKMWNEAGIVSETLNVYLYE